MQRVYANILELWGAYDEYELDEEADKAHDDKSKGCSSANFAELCRAKPLSVQHTVESQLHIVGGTQA